MRWILVAAALLPSIAIAQTASTIAPNSTTPPPPHGHSCSGYYPIEAQKTNMTGTTQLHFTIGTDGGVSGISLAQSSGHAELDDAAIACATHWRYNPATEHGAPIAVEWVANIVWKSVEELLQICAKSYNSASVNFSDIDGSTELVMTTIGGNVINVAVTKSSGDINLDTAATKCLSTMHFANKIDSFGNPQRVRTTLTISWKDLLAPSK